MEIIMDYLSAFLQGNTIFNLLTFVLAVSGIIVSIYFYFKSRKKKAPTYIVRTINLITEKVKKIDSIEILCAGNRIDNLSVSKIAIWNNGKETISNTDVAAKDPLTIHIDKKYEILDTKILLQKNEANDFTITESIDKKSAIIAFDYFDYEEGVIIELLHTGNESDDITISGALKSVKKITRKNYPTSLFPWNSAKQNKKNKKSRITVKPKLLGYFVFTAGVIMAFLSPWSISSSTNITKWESAIYIVTIVLCGFLYMYMGYKIIKRNIPKGFDVFNKEFFSI